MDGGRIKARCTVGDTDVMTARLPRLIHQPRNLGNRRVGRGGSNAHADRIAEIDRSGVNRIANTGGLRRAFAGNHRIVDRALSVFDHTIRRKRLTRSDEHEHSRLKMVRFDRSAGSIFNQDAS